jgi:hypothetical protein
VKCRESRADRPGTALAAGRAACRALPTGALKISMSAPAGRQFPQQRIVARRTKITVKSAPEGMSFGQPLTVILYGKT